MEDVAVENRKGGVKRGALDPGEDPRIESRIRELERKASLNASALAAIAEERHPDLDWIPEYIEAFARLQMLDDEHYQPPIHDCIIPNKPVEKMGRPTLEQDMDRFGTATPVPMRDHNGTPKETMLWALGGHVTVNFPSTVSLGLQILSPGLSKLPIAFSNLV